MNISWSNVGLARYSLRGCTNFRWTHAACRSGFYRYLARLNFGFVFYGWVLPRYWSITNLVLFSCNVLPPIDLPWYYIEVDNVILSSQETPVKKILLSCRNITSVVISRAAPARPSSIPDAIDHIVSIETAVNFQKIRYLSPSAKLSQIPPI